MVKQQGIDVYLAPFGKIDQRYPEHPAPADPTSTSPNNKEVYIEAVDGERFVVVVDLGEDFDAKGSPMVRVKYSFDMAVTHSISHRSYESLKKSKIGGTDLKGRILRDQKSKKMDGQFCKCGLVFSPLEIDEEMYMDPDDALKPVNEYGKIVIEIERGVTTSGPIVSNLRVDPNITASSKTVINNNHVSHSLMTPVLGPASKPTYKKWAKLSGAAGDTMTFTIRYRSRDALQRLKIIPEDPVHIDLTDSPPPSPKVKREKRPDSINREVREFYHTERSVKQEAVVQASTADAHARPEAGVAAETTGDSRTSGEQHDKKRKAVQDELAEIELEQREVELKQQEVRIQQKRLRLKKALAEMGGSGN